MKPLTATILLGAIVPFYLTMYRVHLSGAYRASPQRLEGDVDRDKAIKIAQQYAIKSNIDPTRYDATACETDLSWRVYLEPVSDQDSGEVLEYVITSKGGAVLGNTVLSGWQKSDQRKPGSSDSGTISQAEALAIVKKDLRHHDISKKRLTVCELKWFWRIIYSPPALHDGGGPEYLIDKTTGRIADRRFYQ